MAPEQTMKFKAAAVHAAPVFMDKKATIQKVVSLVEQAAKEDIKLLVFPETFVPGYPVRQYLRFSKLGGLISG
jgi:predicted amidohydrolase